MYVLDESYDVSVIDNKQARNEYALVREIEEGPSQPRTPGRPGVMLCAMSCWRDTVGLAMTSRNNPVALLLVLKVHVRRGQNMRSEAEERRFP